MAVQERKARLSLVGIVLAALFTASVAATAIACYGWYRGEPVPRLWGRIFSDIGMRPSEVIHASVAATILCSLLTKGAFGYAILAGYFIPNASDPARFLVHVSSLIGGLYINNSLFIEIEKLRQIRRQAVRESVQRNIESTSPSKPDPHAFDRLVGVSHAVKAILDALELPVKHPEKVRRFKLKPVKGVLLYGPPGTGKTSLARAAASYFGCQFACITPAYLLDKWVGGSERKVHWLFEEARRRAASSRRPVILFFDEIDAIGRRRDGGHMNRPSDLVLNQLLAELDGTAPNSGVFVIAATNRSDVLDEALLRPGRFDKVIEVGLPDFSARKELFRKSLEDRPVVEDVDLDALARRTEGCSPAVIVNICNQAAQTAARRSIQTGVEAITMHDLSEVVYRCCGK